MSSTRFYDDIAEYYDLIFVDWEESMARQGAAISSMLPSPKAEGRVGHRRILDIAAGIGTQALPLAAQGYEVTARDLSEKAIERLTREARLRGLEIDAGQADMRRVAESVQGRFDAVIAFDNSIPHLLSDEEIEATLTGVRELLNPGGLLLLSVRDYDQIDRASPSHHPYGERDRGARVFRLSQEWVWLDESHYRTSMVIEERCGELWDEVVRTHAVYYAVSLGRLLELMAAAGFSSCRQADAPFYQPVLVGRAD